MNFSPAPCGAPRPNRHQGRWAASCGSARADAPVGCGAGAGCLCFCFSAQGWVTCLPAIVTQTAGGSNQRSWPWVARSRMTLPMAMKKPSPTDCRASMRTLLLHPLSRLGAKRTGLLKRHRTKMNQQRQKQYPHRGNPRQNPVACNQSKAPEAALLDP